jgi:predicted unusual protein kinase regulating ubiquinone biosynthesis (AarF/ABC1/UbiB family)
MPPKARSRSPRRGHGFVRQISRNGTLIQQAWGLAKTYASAPHDVEGLATKMRNTIAEIGGAHRKALQQVAARSDLIPSDIFRMALIGLFDSNPAREVTTLRAQVENGLQLNLVSIERVLKVGTIAEVCVISVADEGQERTYAVKIANLEQKNLFKTDFEMFGGMLMAALSGVFGMLERVSTSAAIVRPLVQQVVNIGNDEKFQEDTMNEFNMNVEARNMEKGAAALRSAADFFRHQRDYFRVPGVIQVSPSGDVLQMDFVSGQNLAESQLDDRRRERVAQDLIEIFFHSLLYGEVVHTDLHPGNVMVTGQPPGWEPGLAIVDWGLVLQVPREHRGNVGKCLCKLCGSTAHTSFEDLFKAFGVTMKHPEHPLTEHEYTRLASLFDIVAGAQGEIQLIEMLREMHKFDWPDWVLLWQKATGALVNTLTHLKAASLFNLEEAVTRTLSTVLKL